MTQMILENVNNIQDLMDVATKKQQSIESRVEDVTNTAEKSLKQNEDFTKIFDKQIKKEEQSAKATINEPSQKMLKETSSNNDIKTLADLKVEISDNGLKTENWADFKEILAKITGEANVETSLNLTLARDINEIISQLKKALGQTTDTTEDTVEKTDVVEDLTAEILIEDEASNEDILGELTLDDTQVEDDGEEIDSSDKILAFEQLLVQINKSNDTEAQFKNDTEAMKDDESLLSKNQDINYSDSEVLDIFNNLSDDEVIKPVDKTSDADIDLALDEDLLKDLNIESIKADVDSAGGESLMQNQTPEEQGIKAMLHKEIEAFDLKIEHLENGQRPQFAQAVQQSKSLDINPSKILDQITKQMEALQNSSKVNIVLNPESLGKVNIQLMSTKEGLMAQFTVQTPEARDMLMKGLDGLKESLISQGVGVDNVSVKLNEAEKSAYNSDWTDQEGSRGGNKGQRHPDREEKEKGLFEKMMAQQEIKDENGNV